ncbi:MAG: methylenetetrahydrofolate--tRNA-(uracil(54)-C(5))-methyltransferase (FADH(2)-oxidizing) TrmFO [Acutalibacteraceae bacterium]
MSEVTVVGGGLAGVEAAWALANRGVNVVIKEMKPLKKSPAHKTDLLAELVCSNSLKAQRLASAAGLLKAEMESLGSVCVECAKRTSVPAGGALAVDRDLFSQAVTQKIKSHPLIRVECQEVGSIPDGNVIIAAGPLASEPLAQSIKSLCGGALSFYDAAAPIVTAQSIDMSKAFLQSRYDRGGESDYINCPMNKEEYEAFYNELVKAETAELHSFDKKKGVYEGCMPIEVMASRGADTMRFGPMKPVGLRDPSTGHRPWAALQLRKENEAGTMYNLVGFQTNLKFGEQKRVFSMIPALKNAEFVRYGVMHRNTFINSPGRLNADFSFIGRENLFFAGQITGVEGYMESAASGIMAGINMSRRLNSLESIVLPDYTMIGALSRYISDTGVSDFQPMGANFGILPPLENHIRDKKVRYEALAKRSMEYFVREASKI